MMYVALVLVCSFLCVSSKSLERAYEHPIWQPWGVQPEDESYQVRLYNSSVWASTNVTAFSENEAAEIGFGRIHRYISGHNKREIIMRMTVPITVDVYQSECVFCPTTFVVSFYIPLIYQQEPPEPIDERILIVSYPDFIVYTRWFDSHPKPVNYLSEAHKLYSLLKEHNVTTVKTQSMALATYDPPFKTFLRENEVWLFYEEEVEEGGDYEYVEEEYIEPHYTEETVEEEEQQEEER